MENEIIYIILNIASSPEIPDTVLSAFHNEKDALNYIKKEIENIQNQNFLDTQIQNHQDEYRLWNDENWLESLIIQKTELK